MIPKRTLGELADRLNAGQMIAFLAGVQAYYHRHQELTPEVEQHINQIIARLREMDGERIEGWVLSEEILAPGQGTIMRFKTGSVRSWPDAAPAILILKPQESGE